MLPPIDKRTSCLAIEKLLSSTIEGNAGATLLMIPKGLTLQKLIRFSRLPKEGNAFNFQFIWNRVLEEMGDCPVENTYRVLITNNILEGSRKLTVASQKELLEKRGVKMPNILEATMLLVANFMVFQKFLHKENPMTYTYSS